MMRRLRFLALILLGVSPVVCFGQAVEFRHAENMLLLADLAAEIQQVGLDDLLEEVDHKGNDAERIRAWRRYLDALSGPREIPSEHRSLASQDGVSVAGDFPLTARLKAIEGLALPSQSDPLRALPRYKTVLENLSRSGSYGTEALAKIVEAYELAEAGQLSAAQRVLTSLAQHGAGWDTVDLRIGDSDFSAVLLIDPLYFAVAAEIWSRQMMLVAGRTGGAVESFFSSRRAFLLGDVEAALEELSGIPSNRRYATVDGWEAVIRTANGEDGGAWIRDRSLAPEGIADFALQIIWYLDEVERARAVFAGVETTRAGRLYADRIAVLESIARGRYYDAWLSFDSFVASIRNPRNKSATLATWQTRYLSIRFQNGYNDRGAGTEMLDVLSAMETGWVDRWAIRQVVAQYYIYHIRARAL